MNTENIANQSNNDQIQKLKTLYSTKEACKAILDIFAARKNNATRTTVDRIQALLAESGRSFSRGQVIEVLKDLDDLQFGSFLNGRRGQLSRMEWDVGIVSLGKVAAGESTEIDDLQETGEDLKADEVKAPNGVDDSSLDVAFPLRPHLNISLRLPKDLSAKEAARLANFVQLLVFESDGLKQAA